MPITTKRSKRGSAQMVPAYIAGPQVIDGPNHWRVDVVRAQRRTSLGSVGAVRTCTRSACSQPAVATLTYDYSDQTAVLGPLATFAEPHSYDLCEHHAGRLSAPQGWSVLRLAPDPAVAEPSHDDLVALADAVREAGRSADQPTTTDQPRLRIVRD